MATLHCGPASCDTSSVKHPFLQTLLETRAADAGDPATNQGGGRVPRWPVGADGGGQATACRGNQVGHQTLPADEPPGRSSSNRLTALLWAPWGPEQNNPNPTTFQHPDQDRKCERLWKLPCIGPRYDVTNCERPRKHSTISEGLAFEELDSTNHGEYSSGIDTQIGVSDCTQMQGEVSGRSGGNEKICCCDGSC